DISAPLARAASPSSILRRRGRSNFAPAPGGGLARCDFRWLPRRNGVEKDPLAAGAEPVIDGPLHRGCPVDPPPPGFPIGVGRGLSVGAGGRSPGLAEELDPPHRRATVETAARRTLSWRGR